MNNSWTMIYLEISWNRGYPQSSSILDWDFPWKPSRGSYGKRWQEIAMGSTSWPIPMAILAVPHEPWFNPGSILAGSASPFSLVFRSRCCAPRSTRHLWELERHMMSYVTSCMNVARSVIYLRHQDLAALGLNTNCWRSLASIDEPEPMQTKFYMATAGVDQG